jgi:alkaline phosphatase D
LRRNHQLFPWICVWDDHETADNSWMHGAVNHNEGEGEWQDRMDYGKKAYFEWLPIRETGIVDPYQIYRAIPMAVILI